MHQLGAHKSPIKLLQLVFLFFCVFMLCVSVAGGQKADKRQPVNKPKQNSIHSFHQ